MTTFPTELVDRFWTYVCPEPTTGCHLWTGGSKPPYGYGHFKAFGRTMKAHRFSWELHCGPIPEELCVLHRCDTPACVNPGHLFLGTQTVNMADRDAKGRHPESQKTHCLAGHPYAGYNVVVRGGKRKCRLCEARIMREARARKRARG